MVGTIYSGRYRIGSAGTYAGVTLSNSATQLPATIANYLYANYGAAIVGSVGTAWTVSNQGLIIDNGSANNSGGVVLPSGGEVINGSTGVGGQGTLTGSNPYYAYGRIIETTQGINIYGGAGTVLNYGVIASSSIGVTLGNGGTIINGAPSTTNATIAGSSFISGGAGTLVNYGTVGLGGALNNIGIDLLAGGLIVNATGGYLASTTEIDGAVGSLINAGTVAGTVTLSAGGLISNAATGTLTSGFYISGGVGSLTNAGSIVGVASFAGNGIVTNTGTLSSTSIGVAISGSGTLVNGQAGSGNGLILGSQYGIDVSGTAALITNFGTVEDVAGQAAILLQAGGYILNQGLLLEQAGSVSAAAVSLKSGGTLVNDGTLSGAPFGAYAQAGSILNNALITAQGNGGDSAVGVEINAALLVNSANVTANWQQAVGAVLVNSATVVNAGRLTATAVNTTGNIGDLVGVGAYILSGGTIINSGTLSASVQNANSLNGVLNVGILATGTLGVSINNTGSIIGGTGVVVARSQNVSLSDGSSANIDPKPNVTLVDSGLIEGTNGVAVQFGDGNNLLQLQPGAQLVGTVTGGTGQNTLGLTSGTGTLYGLGGAVTGFNVINAYQGANWTLAGTIGTGVTLTNSGTLAGGSAGLRISAAVSAKYGNTGTIEVAGNGVTTLLGNVASNQTAQFGGDSGTLALGNLVGFSGTIAGFTPGDTLVLLGTTATSATYSNHSLTINNGGRVVSKLALQGAVASNGFAVTTDRAGNTDIVTAPVTVAAPCFAAGTGLLTPTGRVPVEALQVGARVLTASGAEREVVWLGRRRIDCCAHPNPEHVLPIRILAGAFSPGVPERDVRLSPDHAVAWEGALIPVRYLVNSMTLQQEAVAQIEYWHVELASHDVLLAEGLPAESYLDTGNRHQFDAGAITSLHANFARPHSLMVSGPAIARAKAHLLARAHTLGYAPASPCLKLEYDGRIVAPVAIAGETHRFLLPSRPTRAGFVTLASDTWVPAQQVAHSDDQRRLGVCIAGVVIDGKPLPLDGAALCSGFHALERRGRECWRWTNGRGMVALSQTSRVLELRVKAPIVRQEPAGLKRVNAR
jgi:hypothetical protein